MRLCGHLSTAELQGQEWLRVAIEGSDTCGPHHLIDLDARHDSLFRFELGIRISNAYCRDREEVAIKSLYMAANRTERSKREMIAILLQDY